MYLRACVRVCANVCARAQARTLDAEMDECFALAHRTAAELAAFTQEHAKAAAAAESA